MELLADIRELFARLAQLTEDELTSLREKVLECAKAYDDDSLDVTESGAVLTELADIGDAVATQQATMDQAKAEAEQARQAARDRIAGISGKPNEVEETPEGEPAAEAEPVEGEKVAVTAAGTTISKMAAKGTQTTPSPEQPTEGPHSHLVASGNLYGVNPGDVIKDRHQLARAMSSTLDRMDRHGPHRGRTLIASAEWIEQYPEDRRLETKPGQMLTERDAFAMDAVTHPQALVATGGICAPVNIDWSLGTWAVADRPLRDGLPAFQSTRGGLTFRTPPDISALAAATAVWTEATDFDPGDATKPVLTISCPTAQTVYVAAVSTRLQFGNMESRFDPETVAANTDLAIAAAARVAETNLLTQIAASAVADITTAALLGASRGFLTTLDAAKAAYRDIHRLGDNQTLTVILPRWVKDLIRADRVLELAHDGSSVDPLALPDEYIEGLFSARGIKPIWTLEGLPVDSSIYPAQNFVAFSASSALQNFPAKLVWHMFVEGTIQFLDGGRLDLGVVRDSTLDATNDYETFVETFEGIANRGFSAGCLQFVTSVCANGQSSATATVSSCL